MEIIQNTENKLLGRKEIVAKMENEKGTPKRAEIKKAIAKALKAKEELITVNKVTHQFGNSNITIRAKVYDDEKSFKTNARPHMVKRNHVEVVEEPAEEAAPAPAAEETKEEAPVEEVKEE